MSASGIGSETEVIDEKGSDNGKPYNHKLPGRLTWTEVTLKRGVTSAMDVWHWRQKVVEGDMQGARINCSVVALASDGTTEVARWNFENAWPSKVSGPEMDAGGQDYMVEEITIVHEGVERVA
jgi:phage tail-like protein